MIRHQYRFQLSQFLFRTMQHLFVCFTQVMQENDVFNIVFSSSSKVYGVPQYLPLDELHPAGNCTNPYGKTKYMVEQILQDLCSVNQVLSNTLFLYSSFNANSYGYMYAGHDKHFLEC